ncbi:MAG: hypothetical protein WCQ89_21035 [Verrucomicrobiota bacterium]
MQTLRRSAMVVIWFAVPCVGARAAAEANFSATVPAADFSAAGLVKLTPDELARLDGLVRDFKSGALEQARRDAAVAAAARVQAEAHAARAEAEVKAARAEATAKNQAAENAEKKAEKGLLARAKILLTPGTEIEYATVESRIVGEFRGWEGRTFFRLENGQRWQTAGEGTYVSPPLLNPAIKIVPGALGSFWMTVEGIKPRVKVMPIVAK